LDVEPGEPHRRAGDEHEAGRPPEAAERLQPPRERQNRRSDTKRNDVGKRVELQAEVALGPGQPRDAAVKAVQDERDADEWRRGLEFVTHRVDDAGIAAEHIADREQAGQEVGAATESASRPISLSAKEPEARRRVLDLVHASWLV